MRILILSWYFPPINEIGALRVGKLADYLDNRGHDIWVVTAAREHADQSLAVRLSPDRIIRTGWIDLDELSSPWRWFRRQTNRPGSIGQSSTLTPAIRRLSSLRANISRHYTWLIRFPDRQGGWSRYAKAASSNLLKKHDFDLIYASGPSFTAFRVASLLCRQHGVPWIAEFRDAWTRNHYVPKPEWREKLDEFLESRLLRTAAGIVAVSDPWAEYYGRRFQKPSIAVYNGFDSTILHPESRSNRLGAPLSIVHMGSVYSGIRDPTPLFKALQLASFTPADLRIRFYGATPSAVLDLAKKIGVPGFGTACAQVPHHRALDIQNTSDVLLLLQSPLDVANIPAKMFEYFAARRPILGIGADDGIPARLIRERHAGLYSSNPDVLAGQLKAWVQEKRRTGQLTALPETVSRGLSRADQFARLEGFLEAIVACRGGAMLSRPRSHNGEGRATT